MKRLAAILICLVSVPAFAQVPPKAVCFISGQCSSLMVAGQDLGCTKEKSIVYVILGNGRTMISVPSDAGPLVGFVAEKDAQPTPGSYFMYLARVDLNGHGKHSSADVGGVCHVDMDNSGMVWHVATCQAQDTDGTHYNFSFRGDGHPAQVLHPH